jgi:hypothetical protein
MSYLNTSVFEELAIDIWHQLKNRLRHRFIYDLTYFPQNRFTDFVIRSPTSPWSGLICHLCKKWGGNVHEKGVIEIRCSSTGHNQCWQTVKAKSWIQFDFKDRYVSLTEYSLKSDGNSYCHLVERQLAGSMDCNKWTIVDHQKTQDLNGQYITKIVHCNDNSSDSQSYRYIRLTQTGKDSSGYDFLHLSTIEFFGSMMTSAFNELILKV